MNGVKHVIKCRCVLTQFKKFTNPPLHQFTVFSIIDDDDKIVEKYAQCNNCGLVHKVTDISKSEILHNKEQSTSILTIDDIKISLSDKIVNILTANSCDLPTWENVMFIIEHQRWGDYVVLTTEVAEDGVKSGKILRILGESLLKVENFTRNDAI